MRAVSAIFVAMLAVAGVSGAEKFPEGAGFADKYPQDRRISADPRVLLTEDFERGEIADLTKRWDQVGNEGTKVLAFAADQPPASHGRRALPMTSTLGGNTGGDLCTRLLREVETVFAQNKVTPTPVNRMWLDDIVVAKEYVGPTLP